jgi:hypothetical protein
MGSDDGNGYRFMYFSFSRATHLAHVRLGLMVVSDFCLYYETLNSRLVGK